jgi:hypothetical protein
MFEPPYRALRILLGVFSLTAALGGLLMILADKPLVVRILLRPPEGEVSTLAVSLLKEMGGMVLMLAVFLWLAARDPVKTWRSSMGSTRLACRRCASVEPKKLDMATCAVLSGSVSKERSSGRNCARRKQTCACEWGASGYASMHFRVRRPGAPFSKM